ncbi:HIRAN domain-containing protein [Sphingomonas jatrophae]|uniref:HIRAN domain-containing protein n=1 Tax=Sphingomonas jatrophae TaxID=1166337 RepID=A0A1I6LDD8_9SPHN|nr:HIRAN domain-containing protein [Sphingomonas jatrophae]SFS01437.1 HIRAN domain-containing protein [Sphingomonas jatrophae]
MTALELSLIVVGVPYDNAGPGNRAFEVAMSQPGEPVELRREPRNRHDPQAVAVYSSRGIQIGYLSAERCGWIGGKLAAGETCVAVFQQALDGAAAIRVRFGGGAPTLPPAERAARPAVDPHDFQPDPDPGEWGA